MVKWKKFKLKDLTVKIGSGATPRGGSNVYKEEGISLIRSQNVLDLQFSENGLAFIGDDHAAELRNVIVKEGDVLLNITGDSVARVCKVPKNILPARVNQHVAIIRSESEKLTSDYLLYNLIFQKEELLCQSEIGATRRAITKGMIEQFQIILPSLLEQKAIARVLSNLDDKIDLLNRQNKTLESMAETLFRQWFIEEAKEDWAEVDLERVTSRITDGAHKSPPTAEVGLPMASVKDMHNWGINYGTCRKISENDFNELVRNDCRPLKNDIVIAKDGSYLKHVFVSREDLEAVILSSIAILRPNGLFDSILLSMYLKLASTRAALENIVTGAVIPRIVLKDFRKFPIVLPPEKISIRCVENNKAVD
ncbi:restriction endonuclease subunit S [Candidatus Omnitrophota bacterium]